MRLHVDLHGYGAFSNTVLTNNQNRAVAFGNTGDPAEFAPQQGQTVFRRRTVSPAASRFGGL